MSEEKKSFEDKMGRLEDIVRTLETEPPSLKESLTLYEEGKNISEECRKELEEAEQRVEKLVTG
ncbi:MAG: exodeoxyribonuclease VII small subunit [Thermoplasmata archaeon]|nr:exodeoxyribonuclease VII small subunit [Thermoplasmata archaeon]